MGVLVAGIAGDRSTSLSARPSIESEQEALPARTVSSAVSQCS